MHGNCWDGLCDRCQAELARSGNAFDEGVQSVTSIRCVPKHHMVPPYNRNESAGGECGACVHEDAHRAGLEQGRKECYCGQQLPCQVCTKPVDTGSYEKGKYDGRKEGLEQAAEELKLQSCCCAKRIRALAAEEEFVKLRDESTAKGAKIWADVDKAASRIPAWLSRQRRERCRAVVRIEEALESKDELLTVKRSDLQTVVNLWAKAEGALAAEGE